MAVNYTDLFENLGEFVQRINDYVGLYADLDTDFSEIESDLDANGRQDILSGTFEIFEGFKGQVLGWIGSMIGKTTEILTERTSILEELRLESTDVQTVLAEMWRDMVAHSETIDRSAVTPGGVTESKTNTNAGTLLVDVTLDGVSNPGNGMQANWYYNGELSELAGAETMYVQCISDSETDGLTEGSEIFRIDGEIQPGSLYGWDGYGSGPGPTLTVLQGASLMTNFEFEDFTVANTPDGWDIDNGSVGTQILKESSTVKRGSAALKFTGNASAATIKISQTVNAGVFKPRQRYLVGFWMLGQAGTSAGTMTIQFEAASGYTAASSEKISLDSTALAALTTWTFKYFYINWPTQPPDDMELVIKWTGTPSAHSVRVDGGGVAPVTYHNGVNFVMYAGSEKFVRNDRFQSAISNNGAGIFQEFFRKAYGVQLPSSGTPSQADSLAT